VQFQKYPSPPTEGIGVSWVVGVFSKTKTFKELCWHFQRDGDIGKNPFHREGMDILWNYR